MEIGDKVRYCPEHSLKEEKGVVKSIQPDLAWIVYNCNNDWDNYRDYTGCATKITDLKLGW